MGEKVPKGPSFRNEFGGGWLWRSLKCNRALEPAAVLWAGNGVAGGSWAGCAALLPKELRRVYTREDINPLLASLARMKIYGLIKTQLI